MITDRLDVVPQFVPVQLDTTMGKTATADVWRWQGGHCALRTSDNGLSYGDARRQYWSSNWNTASRGRQCLDRPPQKRFWRSIRIRQATANGTFRWQRNWRGAVCKHDPRRDVSGI